MLITIVKPHIVHWPVSCWSLRSPKMLKPELLVVAHVVYHAPKITHVDFRCGTFWNSCSTKSACPYQWIFVGKRSRIIDNSYFGICKDKCWNHEGQLQMPSSGDQNRLFWMEDIWKQIKFNLQLWTSLMVIHYMFSFKYTKRY